MLEIKFTFDATPELIGALSDIACAIHGKPNAAPTLASDGVPGDVREEKYRVSEKAQNLPSEASVEDERPKTTEDVEEPKKRKQRAKKTPHESDTPVAPAGGDNPSPAGEAEHERATPEETNAPETEPETAPEPAPMGGTDPLEGKGQTGEILAELTRKAIADLDAQGVDRGDANRRIRDYCARNEIKFPTFPALLQAVGYAEAIAICKGA